MSRCILAPAGARNLIVAGPYVLSGRGVQFVTPGSLLVTTFTGPSPNVTFGNGNPANYYHVALLTPGDVNGYYEAIPVTHSPGHIVVPRNVDRVGYSIEGVESVTLTEVPDVVYLQRPLPRGQVAATAGSITTTSVTLVPMPDMTLTISTTGPDVLAAWGFAASDSSGSADIVGAVSVDGVGAFAQQYLPAQSNPNIHTSVDGAAMIQGLSVGSHTFRLLWSTTSGTATRLGNAASLTVIELP